MAFVALSYGEPPEALRVDRAAPTGEGYPPEQPLAFASAHASARRAWARLLSSRTSRFPFFPSLAFSPLIIISQSSSFSMASCARQCPAASSNPGTAGLGRLGIRPRTHRAGHHRPPRRRLSPSPPLTQQQQSPAPPASALRPFASRPPPRRPAATPSRAGISTLAAGAAPPRPLLPLLPRRSPPPRPRPRPPQSRWIRHRRVRSHAAQTPLPLPLLRQPPPHRPARDRPRALRSPARTPRLASSTCSKQQPRPPPPPLPMRTWSACELTRQRSRSCYGRSSPLSRKPMAWSLRCPTSCRSRNATSPTGG